jgi:hypothetical protein
VLGLGVVAVSPVDLQAFTEEAGIPYPTNPAAKAQLLPLVAQWKSEKAQQAIAAQAESSVPQGINPLLVGAGAAGLAGLGIAAWPHLQKLGQTPAVVSDEAVADAVSAAGGPYRSSPPSSRALRERPDGYGGPQLRAGNPYKTSTAPEMVTRGGRAMGMAPAREQGQYKARSAEGFHNPDLANLDTPDKRESFLAGIAMANGTDSEEFQSARALIRSMETVTPDGVTPTAMISGLTPQQRYGTTTAEEEASRGRALAQSRTKSNRSAQAGFRPKDSTPQKQALVYKGNRLGGQLRALLEAAAAESPGDMGATVANTPGALGRNQRVQDLIEGSRSQGRPIGIDAGKASVFFLDSDQQLKPYLGSQAILGPDRLPIYTGLRQDGSVIAESDLAYFPTDDPGFYQRTGASHPALSMDQIIANAGDKRDLRYASDEDQAIKGMLVELGPSDPRFSTGVQEGGVADNWTLSRVSAGDERVPLDVSGFQSELSAPAAVAGGRLRRALDDHRARTGESFSENNVITLAADLAREHNIDTAAVLRSAGFENTQPAARQLSRPRPQAHALAGGAGDALDRIYRSLGMHAGANAWDLEGMVRSGDLRGAAEAMANQLPAFTQVSDGALGRLGQDEKLNVVAEGMSAGLKDLATTLQKYPEMASQFGIGKGAGGFGLDAYLKSYIRDWTTVRGLQLNGGGQPTYHIPNDAFEILAYEGSKNNRSVLHEIEDLSRGAASPLEGVLKLDRIVSSAQSTKEGDPNTNATRLAQTIFDLQDRDLVSTQLLNESSGEVKLVAGTRRAYDATSGFYDRNPNEEQLAAALEDYNALSDDTRVGYGENATLAARVKGTDYRAEGGQARIEEARSAQRWITEHGDELEQQRADFNRGMIRGNGDAAPQSVGRGFVLTSEQSMGLNPATARPGVVLAADTAGLNTSYREELVNDENTTPLDLAQDIEREARINNELPVSEGVEIEDSRLKTAVPLSEAERTASEYGAQKLYFKNLGEGSNGAMAEGDAVLALDRARQWQQSLPDTLAYYRSLKPWTTTVTSAPDATGVKHVLKLQHPSSNWQPEPGVGFEVGASEPVRGIGPKAPPVDRSVALNPPGEYEPTRVTRPEGLVDGAVDPYQAWYRPAAQRLPGNESIVREFPLITGGFKHSDSLPENSGRRMGAVSNQEQVVRQHLPNNVTLVPAMRVEGYPDRPDQIAFTTDWAPRPEGRQPLSAEQIFAMTDTQPRGEVVAAGYPETAALHREALAARSVNGGEGFRDDQLLRDARTASKNLYDTGELSGYGRRGSTFAQAPIAAAPISAVTPAAQQAVDTLAASMQQAPVITDRERQVATTGHYADYMDKLYSQGLTKNAQPKQVGNNRMGAYVAPSDAAIAGRVNFLRKRGIL